MTSSVAYVVDFDGTITTRDISNELAFYYGGEAYLEIENQYKRREMPIRQWLQEVAKLLPADLEMLRSKALEWARIRPGFQRFLEHAREQKSPLLVASDGFGFYIEPVLERHGLLTDDIIICRNETAVGRAGALEVQYPYGHEVCRVCGNCKAAHVVGFKEEGRPVIYVGDGGNDRFGAFWSDHACARDKLAEACRENGFPFSEWTDFYDIIKVEKPAISDRCSSSLCLPRGGGIKG